MAVPKYMARDAELLTAGWYADGQRVEQWDVARCLLSHVAAAFEPLGLPVWQAMPGRKGLWGTYASAASSDCLRTWTPNGQCYYSDMAHWEGCTAEALSPRTYAAQCISALLVAEAARQSAATEFDDVRFYLSAHNADGCDPAVSWGTHVNVAVSDDLWSDLVDAPRRPAVLGFVASALAAMIPWFGCGYLLPLKNGTSVFSLSARAHHLGRLISLRTTEAFQRGILNSRQEPHGVGQQRLHLIGFDYSLISAALQCSLLQCVLAAAEEGYCGLNLYDPVRALRSWSWGLDLSRGRLDGRARLVDGRELTLPEYVAELTTAMLEWVAEGRIGAAEAPEAAELLPEVLELTRYAREGSVDRLAQRLDWAAKLLTMLQVCRQEDVPLGAPVTTVIDQDFASTDPQRGLFWKSWEAGLIDPLVSLEDARACLLNGPAESRAWMRGQLIQRFASLITSVNWDALEFQRERCFWDARLKIELPQLDSLNRDQAARLLQESPTLAELEQTLSERHPNVRFTDPLLDIADQLATDPQRLIRSGA